ncbi:transcriptional regulator [Tyzzerella sp. An114]|uniref:transcriptional regulator GutM n=1 Tax=Tyzzerella sp. An114 TaxID=1965545 RepID=UPI000B44DD64|nr:transcriptional regulator GutM [Tyzzerella sp. An114]OUQ55218.1 transcriptional regulator [Tyzzerella sp. An114]HIT72799.1 transcriptional regulator GutM [Candidatus Fimicola cottocaccae]
MNFWLIAGLLLAGYLLQCFFGLMQIKNFSKAFGPLRKKGKVAIGRVNGGFRAGAIVMFAIDDEGVIIEGKRMMGVTIFAKFKEFKGFEGKNVGLITEEDVEKLPKPLRRAILDAKFNYNTIMSGGEIPPRLSLFQKIGKKFSKETPKKEVSL